MTSARVLAERSCAWAEGPTRVGAWFPGDDATVLGAFERAEAPSLRRGSGGHTVVVGPGTLWVQLVLERSEHPADKLVNRHVRPLLRALTRATSVPAHWFGRDWISMGKRPIGFVGFAHEAASGRCLLEAVVAVSAPFVAAPRASFMGKAPATLEELAGGAIDRAALVARVVEAYAPTASPREDWPTAGAAVTAEPPWGATRDEAIGIVAAGRDAGGRMRVGGELMASRDAVAMLEDSLARGDDVDGAVDAAFTTGVVFGVRSLASIRDAIVRASSS
ncbi:MAG: hypothetical protein KIT84_05995 [Labilithrix sp.]|nr:hypothetical protein [Labilithrix sp.]MCW5810542.1 hypothetical protein [Labilithrix sp.]